MRRLAGILLVIGVAGCGAGSGSFRTSYKSLQNRYRAVGAELSETLQLAGKTSNSELEVLFSDEGTRLAGLHRSLAGLTAPAAGSADYRQYLTSLARVVTDLRTLSREASANQAAGAKTTSAALVSDLNAGTDERLAFEKAIGLS